MSNLLNTTKKYGSIHMFLHWIMAIFLITLLGVGFIMARLSYNPTLYNMHKSFGFIILVLVLFRLFWKVINIKPKLETQNKTISLLASLGHFALYGFMILMPITGILMSLLHGNPIKVFDLTIIEAIQPNKLISANFKIAHAVLGLLFVITITVHVVMAFVHHFILKDDTLNKMMPSKS